MKMVIVKCILLLVMIRLAYNFRYQLINKLLSIKFIRQFFVAQSLKMPLPSEFIIQNLFW